MFSLNLANSILPANCHGFVAVIELFAYVVSTGLYEYATTGAVREKYSCINADSPTYHITNIPRVSTGPPPLTPFLTFISRQSISHRYTHLILALGIVREPTVWGFITSKYIFDEK